MLLVSTTDPRYILGPMYQGRWDWEPGDYAIGVLRVSTDESNQPSRTEQMDFCRKGAELVGLPIPDAGFYYTELSRDVWPRPEVEDAFEHMADPHCKAVIVWVTDRLYADPVQQAETWQVLEECNVKLFDMHGNWKNEPGEMPEAMAGIEAIMARVEVRRTRRRVYETHYSKADHGIFVQKPPYGLRATSVRREWETVPEQVEILKQVYQWVADGVTLADIERRLKVTGITAPVKTVKRGKNTGRQYGGQPWSKSNIRKMVKNRFYRGEIVWNRYKTVRGRGGKKARKLRPESEWLYRPHALGPIIDTELWDAANAVIDRRYRSRDERRVYPIMLFDHFVFCGRCGWRMSPRKRANKLADGTRSVLFDFACNGVHNQYSSCTDEHKVPASWLLPLLAGRALPRAAEGLTVTFEPTGDRRAIDDELKLVQGQLVAIDKELEQLKELALAGFFTAQEAMTRKLGIEAKRTAALERQAELLAAPKGAQSSDKVPAAFLRLADVLNNEALPIEERRKTLGRLIERVILDRPGVRFLYREERFEAEDLPCSA